MWLSSLLLLSIKTLSRYTFSISLLLKGVVTAVINYSDFSILPPLLWKASNFHYSFFFYFWTKEKEAKQESLKVMKAAIQVRQLRDCNSSWIMTKKGNELPNSIFSPLNIIQLQFFLSWKQMSFSIQVKNSLFLFLTFIFLSPLLCIRIKLCCCTSLGMKVINFFSPSASDRLWRNLSISAFSDEKTKLLFCKQPKKKNSACSEKWLVSMFCHHYANKSILIRKLKSSRGKSLKNFPPWFQIVSRILFRLCLHSLNDIKLFYCQKTLCSI